MKFYRVTYPGLWLGGCAIVKAVDKGFAELAVMNHEDTRNFGLGKTEELEVKADRNGSIVLYNDNGDY